MRKFLKTFAKFNNYIVQYDDEEVKKKGEELIHTFCRIVYSTQLKRTNDIRVSVFNLCLQNSRSRRKEKKIGLPQDVLEDMKKNSFTQSGSSSSIPSSSSSSSEGFFVLFNFSVIVFSSFFCVDSSLSPL